MNPKQYYTWWKAQKDVKEVLRGVQGSLDASKAEDDVTRTMRAHIEGRARVVLVHFLRGEPDEPYPVNRLRNIALEAVTTSHFLVTDVDLWPSRTLYNAFLSLPAAYLARERVATVVPAFETSNRVHKELGAASVPETFAGLRLCAAAGMCDVFKHATDTHTSTLYDTWWAARPGDDAYNVPCFDSIRYEPYLLVPKAAHTPAFDERFVGYGKNKIQWVQHVRMLGFAFHVLPQGFVIHVPHSKSKSRDTWNRDNRDKKNKLFMSFIREHMAGANTKWTSSAWWRRRSSRSPPTVRLSSEVALACDSGDVT